jgi:hypothetical protein
LNGLLTLPLLAAFVGSETTSKRGRSQSHCDDAYHSPLRSGQHAGLNFGEPRRCPAHYGLNEQHLSTFSGNEW